jgi:hypothetical protein
LWTVGLAVAALAAAGCRSARGKDGGMDGGAPSRDADVEVRGQGGPFSVCLGPADCKPGLVCTCGAICTIPCHAGGCGVLDAGAVCPTSTPITGACDPQMVGCVRECATSDDCRALGSTAMCLEGWCRIPQVVTLVDGGAPSCDARLAPLETQVEVAVAAADTSCTSDSDCAEVSASNRCLGAGCPMFYVNGTSERVLESLLSTLDVQHCDTILRAGCVLPNTRHGCPLILAPACIEGHCGGMRSTFFQDAGTAGDAAAPPEAGAAPDASAASDADAASDWD